MDTLDAIEYKKMERSCLYSIKQMWGLVPQPLKKEYRDRFQLGLALRGKAWDTFVTSVKPFWFESYKEGFHLTWQQSLVCYGIDKALRGHCSLRISIVSGHGIGKSALVSLLILWFLFIHPNCRIGCTAPSQAGLYDVLWSEIKKWIQKMPEGMSKLFVWESTHIRMAEDPNEWFARAKTASKENTEALAGIHADHVMLLADEASGVEEPIFETMEGSLTSGNILVFLISNGTRSLGYFYDTHHKDKALWQNYSFSSLESPRVDEKYVSGIIAKYGTDSIQYAIRVLGHFPDEGVMDEKGYVQLFNEKDLHFVSPSMEWMPIGRAIGALDASGEGQDKTEWAVRDRQRAKIVAEEDTSNASGMALKSITILDKYKIDPYDFVIDAFGKGQDVGMEIALATTNYEKGAWRVYPVNVGDPCEDDMDKLLYINKRAEGYYKFMKWCRAGGELEERPRLKDQLLSIRFRRTANGRIQIMDKVSSKKLGYPSPDMADAISMTFLKQDSLISREASDKQISSVPFNPFSSLGDTF